jgi:hypothetical protein
LLRGRFIYRDSHWRIKDFLAGFVAESFSTAALCESLVSRKEKKNKEINKETLMMSAVWAVRNQQWRRHYLFRLCWLLLQPFGCTWSVVV